MRIKVNFRPSLYDSDGRERTPRPICYLNATTQRWQVVGINGDVAIHERIEYQLSSKPRKDFRWRHADGTLSRNGDIRSTDRAYGLELVNRQRKGLLVEGERCADAARAVLPAARLVVATVCGANATPEPELLDCLAQVPSWCLWPDADANGKGQEHMARIAAYMVRRCRVRIVTWPDAPLGGDVADYLQSHSRAELLALLREAVRFA
jgi:hypothetical protein